jgi:hypothetical protein
MLVIRTAVIQEMGVQYLGKKYHILRNIRSKVKFEGLENICAEYIGVIGHWKRHFIIYEMSIK